ncbi:membrane protein containing DUF893, YccS/YhfK, partial [mine drainage metagenome]
LTPRSAAFRHAIRTAVCFSLALWLGRILPLKHGYWLPMTVAIVLRADYAGTLSYGLLRMAGTVLGLVLTTALVLVLPANAWIHLAVLAALCAGYRYLGNVHYAAAVACLTGLVVLLLAFVGERPEPTVIRPADRHRAGQRRRAHRLRALADLGEGARAGDVGTIAAGVCGIPGLD